jgi:isopentenyldiphosphate isomerase
MKFSKFNSRRNVDPWKKYQISQNKAYYLANRGKVRVLDSLYTENKTWGALHKAWKGYIIGKNLCQTERTRYYAKVIQKLQYELGLKISAFDDLNIYPAQEDAYSQVDGVTTPYDVEYVSKEDMKEW